MREKKVKRVIGGELTITCLANPFSLGTFKIYQESKLLELEREACACEVIIVKLARKQTPFFLVGWHLRNQNFQRFKREL